MQVDKDEQLPILEDLLCFALHRAARASEASYRSVLSGLGLTYPQYLTLLVIWEKDGRSVSEIGTRLDLESGTLTPIIKRIESHGWVVRKRDSADERVVRIYLTEKGAALKDAVRVAIRALVCRLDMPADLAQRLRDDVNRFRLGMETQLAATLNVA